MYGTNWTRENSSSTPGAWDAFDLDISPIEAPLAIQVISATNLALEKDTAKKVRQYLDAGSKAVWLVYPALRLLEIHPLGGNRDLTDSAQFTERDLFGGRDFTLSLTDLFDKNPEA